MAAAAAVEATDDQLVESARAGSVAAFEALFRRYRDRITAYVRGIVSDGGRAEDIVQDVFIAAHRSLLSSDRDICFKPWVYEIAKNACIDQIRRTRRAHEVSIDSEDFSAHDEGRLSAGVASIDATVSCKEELDSLRMAFNELPEQQHDILVMRELEGLSYDKISSRMGLSRSAVESMLFRARRSLKDGFDDISTGERCLRMQAAMAKLTHGRIGTREERRLTGHLRDCAPCRREAFAIGLDELALGVATGRTRSALSRVAALIPLPGFLRRRGSGGLHALVQAGSAGGDQGVSLAAKAVALVAAAALVGGAAGVTQRAASSGSARAGGSGALEQGSSASRPAGPGGVLAPGTDQAPLGGNGSSSSGPSASGPGQGAGSGSGTATDGGRPSAGIDLGGAGSNLQQSLQDSGAGVGGKAGSLVDGLGSGGGIDSTVEGVTKDTGQAVDQIAGGAKNTVDSVSDTVGSLGGPTSSLPSSTPSLPRLDQGASTLSQTSVTAPSVTLPQTQVTTPTVTLPPVGL